MVAITKAHISDIKNYIRKTAFQEERELLKKEEAYLAEEIRVCLFGGKKQTELADSLPDGWLPMSTYVYALGKPIYFSKSVCLPESHKNGSKDVAYTPELKLKLANHRTKVADLEERLRTLLVDTENTVRGLRTTKIVGEVFPEFVRFFSQSSSFLPMVPTEKSRKALIDAGVIKE